MILKGKVSSIEDGKVRVLFPDKANCVSAPLEAADHIDVDELTIGNNVAVIFFADNLKDGLIIAKF
jgi:hypothetical protein